MSNRRKPRTPKLRHHKASKQGFVELGGRCVYLGRYDLPETEMAYHRVVGEWLSNGRRMPVEPDEITVVEICARYWEHVTAYYTRVDGSPTERVDRVKRALRPLKENTVRRTQLPLALRRSGRSERHGSTAASPARLSTTTRRRSNACLSGRHPMN